MWEIWGAHSKPRSMVKTVPLIGPRTSPRAYAPVMTAERESTNLRYIYHVPPRVVEGCDRVGEGRVDTGW